MKKNRQKHNRIIRGALSGFVVCTVVLCDFPYAPHPEPPVMVALDGEGPSTRVFPVNGSMQVCNPSISQDVVHFPGSMLWLNFSGVLAVNIPDSLKTSFGTYTQQHDRLTISDTSNTVVWFIKSNELEAEPDEEFQDPEWSTHPDYIVSLLSTHNRKSWRCYGIHPVSRKSIKMIERGLNETSTPHLWVASNAKPGSSVHQVEYDDDGYVDSASINQFFGTDSVKLVVSVRVGGVQSLYMKDYSASGGLLPLKRPVDRDGWNCESPLISPDGKWVVYNAYETEKRYDVYLQRLVAGSTPKLLEERASDPHWWINPHNPQLQYVIYQEVPGWNTVYGDLADPQYQKNAGLGRTLQQRLLLIPEAATLSASIVPVGSPELLVNLPTKGGRSPDEKYLCTGADRAFIIGLP